ncbi:hypothetical protein GUA87_11395 [Sneathiella sp. P13V-1]|uniref:hypothetical protein n=1 Tax=Sneathiella sp. P13V-1 TaxID=2697366 RepID=UPI00187B4070|nr:hypothetical protein [Sneathiella sp. P13V-1]MBE7637451.1 hypothetical protein [Sneathiella sp. P13V-1]
MSISGLVTILVGIFILLIASMNELIIEVVMTGIPLSVSEVVSKQAIKTCEGIFVDNCKDIPRVYAVAGLISFVTTPFISTLLYCVSRVMLGARSANRLFEIRRIFTLQNSIGYLVFSSTIFLCMASVFYIAVFEGHQNPAGLLRDYIQFAVSLFGNYWMILNLFLLGAVWSLFFFWLTESYYHFRAEKVNA